MLSYNVALLSESNSLPFSDLAPVAAALSKQMIRDFEPMWRRTATVTAFQAPSAVPVGYYQIIVKDNIDAPGAAGYHSDANNQPYAWIQYDSSWSVTCSHELLEMIADPWGNRLYPGIMQGKRVQILEEMCDPCEAFTYTIDGVSVSDFVCPEFFSAVPRASKTYSFLGSLTAPYQVANGGYISWIDPTTNHWFQETNFGGVQISDLGPAAELTNGFKTLREAVDFYSATHHPKMGKVKLNHTSMKGPF
jgi:hypothetical protein